MLVEEIVTQFRSDADDTVEPYLWPTEDVLRWADEAHNEAALRARLLMDTTTPSVTQIAVLPSVAVYKLNSALYELTRLRMRYPGERLSDTVTLVTRLELDHIRPDWRDEDDGRPVEYAVQDEKTLMLVPTPTRAGTLYLEGYRLPLVKLDDEGKTPEIGAVHHRHLVQWMLHRAFSKPDAETMDPKRADSAEKEFTRYFGKRPDAGLRRETQHNTPQHNRAW